MWSPGELPCPILSCALDGPGQAATRCLTSSWEAGRATDTGGQGSGGASGVPSLLLELFLIMTT